MASVSDKTQHSYADADEFIQYQLEKARSRIKATDLLTAGVLAGLLLVGYVLTFTLLDHWVVTGGFGAWTRAVLLAVVLILCGAILFRYIFRPWFRRVHPLYAARMLDRSSDQIQGSLLALVDLQAAGYKSDRAIHRTLEKRAAVTLADVHVDEAIDRRLLTRLGTGLFIITLITCVYAVLSPKSISLLRPLTFVKTNVATRTVIEAVQPGNTSIPAGSQLDLVADIAGVIPEEIRVLYSTSDRRFVDEPLSMRSTDDEHRFQVRIVGERDRGIRQDLTYRIEAGDAISETFAITVERPPSSRVTEVRYVYPRYMELPERTDSAGAVEAWEGTTLTVLAESSEPVSEAVLQMSDDAAFSVRGEELQMAIDETQLSVDWLLAQREDSTFPKFYRIQVTNPEGHTDPEPVVYPVNVRRDAPPILKLIDPTRDLQVPANAIVPLLVEAEDPDFLLRSVTLHYAVNGKLIQPSEVLLDTFQSGLTKRWSDSWDFRLKPLNLNPGDVVTFHLEARDNRPPLGNQARTGDLNLLITAPVSEKQAQEQLAQDHQMQDQMRQPENSNQQNALKNPEDGSATEQLPSVGSSEKPTPGPDASDEPDQSNDGNEETQPGQGATGSRKRDQRVDDDKALQKLIQRMNRDREESGSDKSQNQNDLQDDSDRVGTESNPQRADGKPGEPNANGSDTDHGNNRKNNSDTSDERPLDSPATDESSGDDTGGNADGQSDLQHNDGAASSEPSSDVAEPQKPDTASDGTTKSGSKPGEDFDQQQEADKQSEKPQNGEPEENSGETSGSESTGESGTDKPPMQNENPLNMNSETGQRSDPNKTGDETSKESEAGGKDAGGKDAGGKEAGGKEAGGKEAGGKEAGGKEAGGKEAGGKEAGGKEAGGKEGGGKEAGGKEAGGKEAGGKEAGGKEGGGKEAGGKEAGGKEAGGKEAGGKEAGGKEAGGKEAGGKEAGGKEAGGKEAGGKEAGGKEAGGKEAGGKEAGGKEAGGKEAGGKEAGGKEAGGKEAGGKEAGGKEAGGKEAGGKEAGGKEAGGKEAGGKEAGGKEAGGKEAGGKEAGGKEAGGKEAGGKEGGGKEGGGKEGGGKEGGGKEAGGKEGGGKEGGGKEGGGKEGGGEGSASGGQQPGAGNGGVKNTQGMNPDPSAADEQGEDEQGEEGQGNGGMPEGTERSDTSQSEFQERVQPADSQADDAASAAALAIKRLQQELDRGQVDPKFLDELGWTEAEMKMFADRLQKQLAQRAINAQQQRERSISEKSFDAMLKGLDLKSTGSTREGRTDYDRDQQDTTTRQSNPPSRYKQLVEGYQRSVSGAKDNKP